MNNNLHRQTFDTLNKRIYFKSFIIKKHIGVDCLRKYCGYEIYIADSATGCIN